MPSEPLVGLAAEERGIGGRVLGEVNTHCDMARICALCTVIHPKR